MNRPKVAFVVQRCGDDIAGGAERLCLQTAQHIRPDWDVEILTTCAREARTWANAYPDGPCEIAGVPATRFPVPVPRDGVTFDRLSRAVRGGRAAPGDEVAWMRAQGPYAPGLFARLADARGRYDFVVFFSYLYATTYFGLAVANVPAVLVPLAHDEWMFELTLFETVFATPRAFAFLSEEERALVERRFPATARTGRVIGVGIEAPPVDPNRFRKAAGLSGELIVCVGRVEEAKGTPELIDYFCGLQDARPEPRTLVLAGPVAADIPRRADVVALGQVPEQVKWDALAAAAFACVPSAYESLSLAALEAWAAGTAILANGASAVLIGQCRRANAGLWYATREEFAELAQSRLFGRAPELGGNGRRFVTRDYGWSAVRERLLDLERVVVPE